MKKIILIAPIWEVYESAKKIILEKGYQNIETYCATLEEGLTIAKKMERLGAEVIISRGGTYQLIKESLKIPVVEIHGSVYDILRALRGIDKNKKVGVVGYERLIRGIEELSHFLNYDFVKIEIDKQEHLKQIIEKYSTMEIDVFVGDSNVKAIASSLKKDGISINSTEQSIMDAIEEAQNIISLNQVISQKAEELKATITYAHEGIIAINRYGHITTFNKGAEEILSLSADTVIGKKIGDIISNSQLVEVMKSKKSEIGDIQDVNGIKIYTNRVPILLEEKVIGAIATFQKVEDLQKSEIQVRKRLNDRGFLAKYQFQDILHQCDGMKKIIHQAKQYAAYDAPIYIQGETGTGKELFAQSIHNVSHMRKGPFIGINCAALPPTLIESELFGYEGGSFTGAKQKGKAGVFELAHNGTLFLDEITEIPLRLQGRLLRALQENEIMRVGGDTIIPIHVRIIAASNRNLWEEVRKGRFRKDLYFRINILELHIPPLRERKEDILFLTEKFIQKYEKIYHKSVTLISEEIKSILSKHSFDGNVRELENLVQRGVILESFEFIKSLLEKDERNHVASMQSLEELEIDYIKKIYQLTGEDIKKSCDILQISRTTLWRKLNMVSN